MKDYCSYQELYFTHETSKDALHYGNSECIEVRLSLLEHHVFYKVIERCQPPSLNAMISHKPY